MFKKVYIIFGLFIPFISLVASYPWPLKPDTVQHPVTGTLGEYRVGHLHQGVDIDGNIGTNIYPVVDGIVKNIRNENTYIECVEVTGNDGVKYEYIHIDASVKKNDVVKAGVTILGKIKAIADPHLHFEVNDGMNNPLDSIDALTPYIDTVRTVVWGGDNFTFYKHGTSQQLFSSLWGKIDILVRAKDKQKPGSENVGVYRIGYLINNMEGDTILPYTENIKFDNASGKVDYIYDESQSNNSTYYYFVTNALGLSDYDRYLNTKLKKEEKWDGENALINQDAVYPDGKYKVWVLAYDIKGNGGDMEKEKGAADKEIDVDNFVPFVDEVTVTKDEEVRYNGKWELNGDEMELDIPTDDSVSKGDSIRIIISFSEIMKTEISVKIRKEGDEVNVEGSWDEEDKSLWEGKVKIPDAEESEGEWTIMISSKDLADNTLDIDPNTIGERDEEGWWEKYDLGDAWDRNHKILVGVPPSRRGGRSCFFNF